MKKLSSLYMMQLDSVSVHMDHPRGVLYGQASLFHVFIHILVQHALFPYNSVVFGLIPFWNHAPHCYMLA